MQKYITIAMIILFSLLACGPWGGDEAAEEETPADETQAQVAATPTPEPTATVADTPVPSPTPEPQTEITDTSPIETPAAEAARGETSPILPQSPADRIAPLPGTGELVTKAKGMLAEMSEVSVAADQIALVAIESQEWADTSMGCPKEGQMYAQVITPGYWIMLEAGGVEYEFHTDTTDIVVPCFDEEQ